MKTCEEYVVAKLQKLEEDAEYLRKKNEELTEKIHQLVGEIDRVTDQMGDIAEILNPTLRGISGNRYVQFDTIYEWEQGGKENIDKLVEIFGLGEEE